MKRLLLLSLVTALLSSSAALRASEIQMDWGSGAQAISGDADVNAEGTQVLAYYFTSNPTGTRPNGGLPPTEITINGTLFTQVSLTSPTSFFSYNENTVFTAGSVSAYNSMGSQEAPFSSLSGDYQTLLSGGIGSAASDTLTLTLSGLTVGQQYIFQFWTSNSAFDGTSASFNTTGTAATSISMSDNIGGFQGATGQHATGFFTATDTTESMTFSGTTGTDAVLINAFQLRAAPVPEPSTFAFVALGLGSLIAVRRRISSR